MSRNELIRVIEREYDLADPLGEGYRPAATTLVDALLPLVVAEVVAEGQRALREWIATWPTTPGDGTFLVDIAREGRARADALATQPASCLGNDPSCPCQDGDACHYQTYDGSPAWPVTRPANTETTT